MEDENEYPSSDSEDGDYVPTDGEEVSEEPTDNEVSDGEPTSTAKESSSMRKRKKKTSSGSRKKRGGIRLEGEEEEEEEKKENESEAAEEVKEEDKKKRVDALWSDFLKDVGEPLKLTLTRSPVPKSAEPSVTPKPVSTPKQPEPLKVEKTTITKIFDFAGEEVRVTEEVDVNSKEARIALNQSQGTQSSSASPSLSASASLGIKRSGGLQSLVGQISGKKNKMSTLTKSSLDWNTFKEQEGIEEELERHNKGKDGYLERQAFLQRTDLNQFEKERDMRLSSSRR